MPGSQIIAVPAGTQSVPFPVTPLMSVYVAPQVLGGTITVESAPSLQGPWQAVAAAASIVGVSYRPALNAWIRVSAAVQQAVMVVCDMGGANQPTYDQLCNANCVMASGSQTAIQPLFSFRLPPGFLPLNFCMEIEGRASFVNNANAKTLTVLINGITGTSILTSPALASLANFNFEAQMSGDGFGTALKGYGAGSAGGFGTSTTAYTSLARDYINNETEIVIAATKATAGDLMQLDSLRVTLY